jgi:hypothetical protein
MFEFAVVFMFLKGAAFAPDTGPKENAFSRLWEPEKVSLIVAESGPWSNRNKP